MNLKKAYYYIICLSALLILFWGVVDLSGAAVGQLISRGQAVSIDQPNASPGDQSLDAYYQKKIFNDRLSDSLARIIVAGLVFGYCRKQVDKLES
ncbi:MAG: hypothetical protein PHH14_02005 [Candidatus Margulisbacteria bacterium]|nr:hypothetical protein [Candidatus Margulisiibacteriota bacterium]